MYLCLLYHRWAYGGHGVGGRHEGLLCRPCEEGAQAFVDVAAHLLGEGCGIQHGAEVGGGDV